MANSVVVSSGEPLDGTALDSLLPPDIRSSLAKNSQKAIPALAKNELASAVLEGIAKQLPTHHTLILGDSRTGLEEVDAESVHLVLTSPPYWTLKAYPDTEGQLGRIGDFDLFLDELDEVWRQAHRVLVPGGRMVIVVGDVCIARREFGRHLVAPLHAAIQEHCRRLGFDNLAPIIWYKIANARFEVDGGPGFLGKPYEPNGVIKNDIEYILFQRKPGGYRRPVLAERALSVIPVACHHQWFQQVWSVPGASTRNHPAPFPLTLAERLIRMFSFVGDTVLDPFMGSGTTNVAACAWGRNSLGIEIEDEYFQHARSRLERAVREHRQAREQTPAYGA